MIKSDRRMTDEELIIEANRWDTQEVRPDKWEDCPDAIPRKRESVSISIRIPCDMLLILKEFAKREGQGYQVLMKRWLDDRIRVEREWLRKKRSSIRVESSSILRKATSFKSDQVLISVPEQE